MTGIPEGLLVQAKQVLKSLGVTSASNVQLTAVYKVADEWHVNFTFLKSDNIFKTNGCFAVSATSGEINGMWLDRVWK